METQQTYRSNLPAHWLESEFVRRKNANPRYSLRAYAKALAIPPGRLSEILSRKRNVSPQLLEKVAERLGLSPNEKIALLPQKIKSEDSYETLAEDNFSLIAEGAHIAFLCLMETKNFRSDLSWIAKRLGISTVEARAVALRLERLGLIQKERTKWKRTENGHKTTNDIPSAALRRSHKETLNLAIAALDSIPVEERDISSMTMAIDPTKLPLAKSLIREFRYRLADLLESGNQSEVYHLNVQLIPVTHKETRK